MPTMLSTAVTKYLRSRRPSQGTANGYRTTLKNGESGAAALQLKNWGEKKFAISWTGFSTRPWREQNCADVRQGETSSARGPFR